MTGLSASPNRLLATIFGVVYLLVRVLGFIVTGCSNITGTHAETLIHLAIGALLLLASRTVATAKAANTGVGAVYLLVGIIGLFVLDSSANILALNGADNVLHLASAIVLLGVGLTADKRTPAAV